MPGDPQIISVQNWLNTTYGWHSQWVAAPTHGFTGWETIYALTRALQIELNITGSSDIRWGSWGEASCGEEHP